jgi:histidinol-phosphate aminotransferase
MYFGWMTPAPRPAVLRLPAYRAGRRPGDIVRSPGTPAELARLASNESPFGPLPSVRLALESQLATINRYPEMRAGSLRAALAEWLEVPANHVLAGAGSTGLLWQLAETFLDDGSDLVAPWPSFEGYPIVAQLMGARFVPVPLRAHTADVDAVLDAHTPATRIVVVAEPNNPTSTSMGWSAVDRLAEATADRCLLVVDEAYLEFAARADARRGIELVRRHEHVVLLRTFSKAHGLAGLRVGYAVGRPPVIELIERVGHPFAVSSLADVAARASLAASSEVAARVEAVVRERVRVQAALDALVDAVPRSQTNFVFIPTPDQAERWASELERAGVITRPAPGFGLRVTVGDREDNDRFLAAFRTLLHRQSATRRVA